MYQNHQQFSRTLLCSATQELLYMMVPIMSTVFLNFFYFFIFREFLLRICILSSKLKLNIRETRRVILVSRLRTACAQTY